MSFQSCKCTGWYLYDSLQATLQESSYGSDYTKAIEAKGLHCQVATFAFIVILVMFDRILSCTKTFRPTQVDLAKVADLVSATMATLEEYHNDNVWEKLYHFSVSIAKLHSIELLPIRHREKRFPKHLEGSLVLESVGSRQQTLCSDDYKISMFFPVWDAFLSKLSR